MITVSGTLLFLDTLKEALELAPMRILSYCLMPNHWHLVLYPKSDGDISRFLHCVTLTHTQRYHAKTKTIGYGHIYQGRYKSIPVEQDRYFWPDTVIFHTVITVLDNR